MAFKDILHRIGYLAVAAHWPQAIIMSKEFIDTAGEHSGLLNTNPHFASHFLVVDKAAPEDDRLTSVWTFFTNYVKDDPTSGVLKISESQMRNIVTDFYLYSNIKTTGGFIAKPKVRIIVIVKVAGANGDQVLFSRPIRGSDLVTWHGNAGDLAFDSPQIAATYAAKADNPGTLDPRMVMPGHYYNLLRSHDFMVPVHSTGNDLIYEYPFDFINPADRANRKSEPDYLYSSAKNMCLRANDLKAMAEGMTQEPYLSVGVAQAKTGGEVNKGLFQTIRTPDKITSLYNEIKEFDREDAIAYLKTKHTDFKLYPDYTWYTSSPMATILKEFI